VLQRNDGPLLFLHKMISARRRVATVNYPVARTLLHSNDRLRDLAGGADLRFLGTAGKPCLAPLAVVQSDYFHGVTLRVRRGEVVALEQPEGLKSARCELDTLLVDG
jgi:hypothetical protein